MAPPVRGRPPESRRCRGTVEFGNNEVRETNAARQWQAVPPRPHTCAPLLAGRDTRRCVTGGQSDG